MKVAARILKSLGKVRLPIETIVAAVAALTMLSAKPAHADDGVCVSTYSMQFPAGANQFYATKPHSNGVNVVEDPYPTAFRGGFTTSAKAEVWTVPAKENSFWWYVSSNRTLAGHPAPPVYSGTFSGGALSGYTQAERDAGLYPGYYTESRMMTDSESRIYRLNHHLDPQQFATRFVLKDVYPAILGNFNYAYTPDINVPDSVVQAAATANATMLTQATVDRLRGYIESGNVTRNYLDLTPSAIIRNEGIGGVNGGNFTRWVNADEFAGCGTFAEIVKHPRLKNVYILKYFIRTATITGLAPFNKIARAGTFIAYAPYLLGPAYEAPKLNPDSVSGPANEEVEIKPLDNDTVGSTGTLSLVGVSTPAHGTVTWNGNNVTYMPGSDFSGMDTMVYTVTDGVSNYSSTISVQISSVPPKLNPDTVVTGHTVPVTFNVLANDTDPDGPNPLRVTSVTQPEHGSLSWNANGSVTFYPENSFIGTFTATYTATDGVSTSSSYIVFTTIQCFKDVWRDAGLQCDSRNPQGSADFAASCQYSPSGYDQEEITCPAN